MKKGHEEYPSWFRDHPEQLQVDDEVIATPDQIDGYRNKVEFTVGRKYAGNSADAEISEQKLGQICIGFNRGNLSKGITFVDEPDEIRVNPKQSVVACKRMEKIVEDFEKEFDPYDRSLNRGFWRVLLYRESVETKQVLISVVVSKGYTISEELKTRLKDSLTMPFNEL